MELGFQVAEASRGEEALQALRSGTYDAVLLDINMPGIGGIETLRRIRTFAPRLPVLMLTVRDEEEDKVEALDLGADDYVTKPFSTRELIARIRSAVRRVRAPARPEDAPIEIGEIRLEPVKRRVTKRGAPVKLTRKEFDILYCLMSRAGTRGDLCQAADRRVGRRMPRGSRVSAHLRAPVAQKDRGRPLESVVSAHGCLCRLPLCRRA
jgi:two-component system, OmpR family, KDP operon response regulator KdpE